jgi:hypothetical protein
MSRTVPQMVVNVSKAVSGVRLSEQRSGKFVHRDCENFVYDAFDAPLS